MTRLIPLLLILLVIAACGDPAPKPAAAPHVPYKWPTADSPEPPKSNFEPFPTGEKRNQLERIKIIAILKKDGLIKDVEGYGDSPYVQVTEKFTALSEKDKKDFSLSLWKYIAVDRGNQNTTVGFRHWQTGEEVGRHTKDGVTWAER